ncbi:uncharacterized protein LOC110686981 [Chenopodium quinoa]|uniref:uncharacterized protein LOC110686981 n=1 Tax=Chenopodium quinoa TaxID=63459 RepID=UPI000B798292|nr:uncharacterized protein LOC110686981 [Chenopodium quinoa]
MDSGRACADGENSVAHYLLRVTKEEQRYKKPRPLPQWYQQKNKDRWCEFHESSGHHTEECIQLKDQIEDMVRKGYWKKYLADHREKKAEIAEKDPRQEIDFPRMNSNSSDKETFLTILTISGGLSSRRERKRHLRALTHQVNNGDIQPPQSPVPNMTFTVADFRGVTYPHEDPLVIIRRTLIDGGSGANILFRKAYNQIKLKTKHLTPVPYPVSGFDGSSTYPDGKITLLVTIDRDEAARNFMAEFLVIDAPSVYNMIIGRPMIHEIQGVVSTYHQIMIHVSNAGYPERIEGSQMEARRCNYLKPSTSRSNDDDEDEEEKEMERSAKKPKGLSASAKVPWQKKNR